MFYIDCCKSQYNNAGFGQNKNVGFPTFLYCLFPTLLFYPLQQAVATLVFDSEIPDNAVSVMPVSTSYELLSDEDLEEIFNI